MIFDALAAKSPHLASLLLDTHLVRLPYPVAPRYPTGIPEQFVPRSADGYLNTDFARMPFPLVGFVGPTSEQGLVLCLDAPGYNQAAEARGTLPGPLPEAEGLDTCEASAEIVALTIRLADSPLGFAVDPVRVICTRDGRLMTDRWGQMLVREPEACAVGLGEGIEWTQLAREPAARVGDLARAVEEKLTEGTEWTQRLHGVSCDSDLAREGARQMIAEFGVGFLSHYWKDVLGHAGRLVVSALSLLNARNVEQTAVVPQPKVQAHRKRNAKLPLYTYHVLKLRPGYGGGHGGGTGATHGDQAVHWVRGHFKRYDDKGLFGKYPGLWWWGPHLAGTSARRVEKDYDATGRPGFSARGRGH